MTDARATAAMKSAAERGSGTPVLLSVDVGMPKNVPCQGKTVYTGVCKHPVEGP